jgi:putative ABC transport system permease protein
MLRTLTMKLRSLARRGAVERELDEELRFHLEMETAKNVRRGMDPEEARYTALRAFGGVEQVKESCRDTRGVGLVETLAQDLRYGLRMLAKRPAFTLMALLVLGLGIGANAAIFSVVRGVLLRPLPYENGERIVVLHQPAIRAGVLDSGFSPPEVRDYREQNRTLDAVVEYHNMTFTLLGRAEPERVETGVVSPQFFDVLATKPLLGRTFEPTDDGHGAEPVLVLSHAYWQRSFAGEPNVVGQTV